MNNNIKYDPMTGEPIQQSVNIQQPETQEQTLVQNEFQNIPRVEQSQEEFINNVQSVNTEKKEEKKDKINYTFIIILFIIIFASIFFLFPILDKYI